MKFVLRAPRSSDWSILASWIPDAAACLRWAGPRIPFPFSAADLPSLLDVAGGLSHCLADADDTVCGFGQHWVVTPGAVHLGRIIVAPDSRGQGVGGELCRQLIAAAVRYTGAHGVTLRVYRDNAAAVALYTNLGFIAVNAESTDEVMFMHLRVES